MSARDLLRIVSVILGFINLVWVTTYVGWLARLLVRPLGPQDVYGPELSMALSLPVLLLTGVILIRFSDGIAGRLARYAPDSQLTLPTGWDLEGVPPVIGIVTLVFTLPGLVQEAVRFALVARHQVYPFPVHLLMSLIGPAAQVAIGIYLLSGGKLLLRWIQGRHPAPDAQPSNQNA